MSDMLNNIASLVSDRLETPSAERLIGSIVVQLIIGGSSRIAQRFVAANPHEQFIVAGRQDIELWLADTDGSAFERFVDSLPVAPKNVHLFAAVTDPRSSTDVVTAVNVALPGTVLDVAKSSGFAVTTYGTALESLGPSTNAYLESKRAVAALVDDAADSGVDAMHVRFHTVYGSALPQPHMFLGQILDALVAEKSFDMSSGEQLREYHHVDDLVEALNILSATRPSRWVTISHGMPVQLRVLAESIFSSFDRTDLLNIGAIASAPNEVFQAREIPTVELAGVSFREPIAGVVDYMHQAFAMKSPENERNEK